MQYIFNDKRFLRHGCQSFASKWDFRFGSGKTKEAAIVKDLFGSSPVIENSEPNFSNGVVSGHSPKPP